MRAPATTYGTFLVPHFPAKRWYECTCLLVCVQLLVLRDQLQLPGNRYELYQESKVDDEL